MYSDKVRCALAAVLMIAAMASSSPAQLTSPSILRGPVVGYVHDAPRQNVRPVNGIPGSLLLGEPLDLPFAVTAAAFSPQGDFAVVTDENHAAYVLRDLREAVRNNPIEGAIGGVDRVFFNADASSAVLLAADARRLQIVRGLPAFPAAEPPLDLSSISGKITTLAIDAGGSRIVIAVSADYGSIFLVSELGIRRLPVGGFNSPAALALIHGDQDVIVADSVLHEITLVRDIAGFPQIFRLAGERDGILAPVGLRISDDGRKLYIANGASRTLHLWNFETQSIEMSYPLDAEATRLTPLQGASFFVLNEVGNHPLVLVDSGVNPAVYFVPADRN